jgi:hypothetical protein
MSVEEREKAWHLAQEKHKAAKTLVDEAKGKQVILNHKILALKERIRTVSQQTFKATIDSLSSLDLTLSRKGQSHLTNDRSDLRC